MAKLAERTFEPMPPGTIRRRMAIFCQCGERLRNGNLHPFGQSLIPVACPRCGENSFSSSAIFWEHLVPKRVLRWFYGEEWVKGDPVEGERVKGQPFKG